MFKVIRWLLSGPILFLSWVTQPTLGKRSPQAQEAVEQKLQAHTLYQFKACPFCIKVRRTLRKLNLPMELRDAQHDQQHREALLKGGGKIKTPCLRIEHANGESEWMYESNDIIAYLNKTFPV